MSGALEDSRQEVWTHVVVRFDNQLAPINPGA